LIAEYGFPWGPCRGIINGHRQKNTEYGRVGGVQRSTTELRVKLWSVNQRTTEAEESPSLIFRYQERSSDMNADDLSLWRAVTT
jgi:hypothetical protein